MKGLLGSLEVLTEPGRFLSDDGITPSGWALVGVATVGPLWFAWAVGQVVMAPFNKLMR